MTEGKAQVQQEEFEFSMDTEYGRPYRPQHQRLNPQQRQMEPPPRVGIPGYLTTRETISESKQRTFYLMNHFIKKWSGRIRDVSVASFVHCRDGKPWNATFRRNEFTHYAVHELKLATLHVAPPDQTGQLPKFVCRIWDMHPPTIKNTPPILNLAAEWVIGSEDTTFVVKAVAYDLAQLLCRVATIPLVSSSDELDQALRYVRSADTPLAVTTMWGAADGLLTSDDVSDEQRASDDAVIEFVIQDGGAQTYPQTRERKFVNSPNLEVFGFSAFYDAEEGGRPAISLDGITTVVDVDASLEPRARLFAPNSKFDRKRTHTGYYDQNQKQFDQQAEQFDNHQNRQGGYYY